MIDGPMVVAQAQHGQVPPYWQVFRGKRSHFYNQAIAGLIVLLIAAGLAFYLYANPNIAIVPGYSSGGDLAPDSFNLYRMGDYVFVAVLAALGIFYLIKSLVESDRATSQMLVLMPQGFVIHKKTSEAYVFSAYSSIKAVNNRGSINLQLYPVNSKKATRVTLDGRFGNPRQLAQLIIQRFQASKQPPAGVPPQQQQMVGTPPPQWNQPR
ncbi:MAG TPA: hypothetical protein VFA41_14275 [Ktedonobacteraceae bacterium]|jgi:hypothetical protein|nr:hypothetical protein [Ktedonobacteraceae bacterium]